PHPVVDNHYTASCCRPSSYSTTADVLHGEPTDPVNFFSDRSSNCFSSSYIPGTYITNI
ncbi:hypothetical protein A2U01_0089506, partial [Trifolium medium]|nr:hypothetical protein [Trifolium medium]